MTLFGNRIFAAVIKVKIKRSHWLRVGPKSSESFCIRDRKGHTKRYREEGHVKTEARTGVILPQAKECQSHQKLEEGRNRFSSKAFRGSVALPTPWFWTSGFQNCKKIKFCGFKPRNLWQFVLAALGNQF